MPAYVLTDNLSLGIARRSPELPLDLSWWCYVREYCRKRYTINTKRDVGFEVTQLTGRDVIG